MGVEEMIEPAFVLDELLVESERPRGTKTSPITMTSAAPRMSVRRLREELMGEEVAEPGLLGLGNPDGRSEDLVP